jgi:hypothetical protein
LPARGRSSTRPSGAPSRRRSGRRRRLRRARPRPPELLTRRLTVPRPADLPLLAQATLPLARLRAELHRAAPRASAPGSGSPTASGGTSSRGRAVGACRDHPRGTHDALPSRARLPARGIGRTGGSLGRSPRGASPSTRRPTGTDRRRLPPPSPTPTQAWSRCSTGAAAARQALPALAG